MAYSFPCDLYPRIYEETSFDGMNTDARRDPRFQVTAANSVSVSAKRRTADSGPDISGVLLDLSRSGLRLRLEAALPKGEEIRLDILANQLDCQFQSDATVRWVEPDSSGHWIIGCDLAERIPQETIDDLATGGTLDRRNDLRQAISFTAEAKAELEPGFKPVQIVDISDGGFCALADDLAARENDRLLIRIHGNSDASSGLIRARVTWLNQLEGGQAIGCLFLTKADHSLMHAISNYKEVEVPEVKLAERFRTSWSMVAAAVLIITFVQFFLLKM